MSSISVFTWNICFGCMYSNKLSSKDASAVTLATTCEKKRRASLEAKCVFK